MQSALSLQDPSPFQWVLTSVILLRWPVSSYGEFLGRKGNFLLLEGKSTVLEVYLAVPDLLY